MKRHIFIALSMLCTLYTHKCYAYYERPFVVLICGYNVAPWVAQNLHSIAQQNYSNYRIIYVNDCSTDDTQQEVATQIKLLGLQKKCTIIHNTQRQRKLANMYHALHTCDDDEIVLLLDADDWLEDDPYIFKKINDAYAQHDCWFTYSQYRNEPKSEAKKWGFKECGYSAPVPRTVQEKRAFRNHTFVYMHLRTFYAWLFKQIKIQDLIAHNVPHFAGTWYPASNDLAIVFPMVEMAGDRVHFMPETLYVRNVYSDLVGFKVDNHLQIAAGNEIRQRAKYTELHTKQKAPEKQRIKPIDAVLFFNNNVRELATSVRILRTHCKGLRDVVVMYIPSAHANNAIQKLRRTTDIKPCPYYDDATQDAALHAYLVRKKTTYVIMCPKVPTIAKKINLKKCCRLLAKTSVDRFYVEQCVIPHKHITLGNAYIGDTRYTKKKYDGTYLASIDRLHRYTMWACFKQ